MLATGLEDLVDEPDNMTCQVGYDDNMDGDYERMTNRTFQASALSYPDVISSMTLTGGNDVLVYDSVRGMLKLEDPAFASGLTVELVSSGGKYALNVQVDRLGRVTMCSPVSVDHSAVPGYASC